MPTRLLSRRPRAATLPLLLAAAVAVGSPALPLALHAQGTATTPAATAGRAITFADFAAVRNVSDPQLSPDGRLVLYAVRTTDVDANRRTTVTTLRGTADGAAAREFPAAGTRATEARWSPDGRRVAYVAGGQLWVADASGANPRQLTKLEGGASGPVWSPVGDAIAFTSAVYPSCTTDACNADSAKARDTSKVKAVIADRLMYRHWTSYDQGTRSHLFVVAADGTGQPRDLVPGAIYDVPPGPFGGSEGYAFAPDGRELAYTAKDQGREQAWTTDVNLYTVPVAGGASTVITTSAKGVDANPVYSPDGRFIAYSSLERPGFEADRGRLMLYDRAARTSREMLTGWDRSADAYMWAPDSRAVYVQAADAGRDKLFRATLDARGTMTGRPAAVVTGHNNLGFSLARNGRMLAWVRDAAQRPGEVHVAAIDAQGRVGAARALTYENDALVRQLSLSPAQDFWFKGAGGDSVHGFIVRPPNFDPSRKYPAILLIHGGPQGAWLDSWHSRWNYQMLAASGAGLIIVNPRGSTGYGQKFVDDVSQDWGGKPYVDLMNGVDAALAANPWMDGSRLGATGGSYGGYMTNWIAGHTDRFKALVTHAGVFNLESMAGATEELWFTEWEFGGQYWDSTAMAGQYRKWSPHLSAGNFKTPMLVLHGELDYRVPYTEGLSVFTALQRRGVPSRMVLFPDEGHWIGKPQNQRLWWREMQGWFAKYLTEDTRAGAR